MLLHFFHAASSSRPAYLRRVILALALLCLSALGHAASANTLTVPAQYATIQAAINAAVSGDTVLIADGTYTGPGNVDLDFGGKSLTVASFHGQAKTVIDCGGFSSSDGSGDHRGFTLHSGETGAVISGFTIENGYESGHGSSDGSGGGIDVRGSVGVTSVSVTVQNCALTGNTALSGGGLENFFSTVTLVNCALTGNTAANGGGISNDANLTLINCALSGNTAPGGVGGGVFNLAIAALTNCTLEGNTAPGGDGGGLENRAGGTSNNSLTLTGCALVGNTADQGGGLYNYSGASALTNCTLEGNTAANGGGGVSNSRGGAGFTLLTSCTLTGNTAQYGGGLDNGPAGAAVLTNDILYGDAGGEVYNAFDHAKASGPAVPTNPLHRDAARHGDKLYRVNGGSVQGIGSIQGIGSLAATYCDVQGGYAGAGNVDADPLFVLASLPYDLHPRPGSPCLGAGTHSGAPAVDKDGTTRPNPPAIGAYEAVSILTVPAQYATIQAALNASVSGDTILISDGVYSGPGNVDLDFGGKNVTVTSVSGPASTIIDCGGLGSPDHRGFYFHSAETNAVVSGLTIRNGRAANGGGIFVNFSSVSVRNCILTANTATQSGGGIYSTANSGGTILLADCTLSGNTAANGGGLYNDSLIGGAITVTGCAISTNTASQGGGAVENDSSFGGGPITLTDCTVTDNVASRGDFNSAITNIANGGGPITLTNCTLAGNVSSDGSVYNLILGGGTVTLTNDVCYGDTGGEVVNDPNASSNAVAAGCDVQGGYAGTGDIDADPLFTSPAFGDVHLRPGSPCLGAGLAVSGVAADKDGTPRPTPPSIGAYELGSTLTVPAQYATIQAAINAANPGNTVLISDGTYAGPGDVDLDFGGKSLTVSSVNGPAGTIIDCGGFASNDGSGNHRGFILQDGEAGAVIRGLTIKNGYERSEGFSLGGGIRIGGAASATVQNCVLEGNTADQGGGLYNQGTVTLADCALTGNTASGNGGGLDNDAGTATLTGCTFGGNTASGSDGGGGLCNFYGTVTLTGCALEGNSATNGSGGGLDNDAGTVTLTNCALEGNTAQKGGGLENVGQDESTLTLTDCTLTGNTATLGGGLHNNYGAVVLTDDILYGDTGGELLDENNGGTLGPLSASYCDVGGGLPSGVTDGGGNLDAAPLFTSPATGDLHPRPGSPCLGAGIAVSGVPADKDGRTRPDPPAIGAYEAAAPALTHLLWDNTDGRMMFWNLDAQGSLLSLQGYGPYTDDGKGLWHAKALATGADGASRIVWNNGDGRVMLWSVDRQGGFLGDTGYGPYTDDGKGLWHAAAVSVGPDNRTRLLWNDDDGRVMLWSLDAQGALLGYAGYGPYTDATPQDTWRAVSVSTGPDRISHVLWDNADHRIALWDVRPDFGVAGIAGYGPYTDDSQPNPAGNLWDGVGVSAGPDGLPHVLWGNTDRRAMLWGLGGSGGVAGYGPYDDDGKGLWGVTGLAAGPDGVTRLLWNDDDRRVMLWSLDGSGGVTGIAGYGPYTDASQPDAAQNLWSAVGVSAGP